MRYLQSMDRATILHLHDKSLHGFPYIWVESFIQSMKHVFFAFNLFGFCFCFYFILLFFWIFERLKLFFLRTQDERTGWWLTWIHWHPPKLEWSSVGLLSWMDFFCMQCKVKRICKNLREFKYAMMIKGRLCKNINYPICKCKNG